MTKTCPNCQEQFEARRKNHKYCTTSCKTMASFKRNKYKYQSGRYIKDTPDTTPTTNSQTTDLSQLNSKLNKLNSLNATNAMAGTLAADAIKFAGKKLLNPNSLNATKGDIKKLEKHFSRYHFIKNLPQNNIGQYPYYDIQTQSIVYGHFSS